LSNLSADNITKQKMNIVKLYIRNIILIFIINYVSISSVWGYVFKWEPKSGESPFVIDIPSNWQWTFVTKKNGAIVTLTDGIAVIEVRSINMPEQTDAKTLLNLKAARMSARFNYVKLLYERKAQNHRERYLAAWRIVHKNKSYIERTAFISEENKVLALSCLVSKKDLIAYRVICDNAVYSLDFEEMKEPEPEPEPIAEEPEPEPIIIKIPPEEKIYFTKEYILFNRPNGMYRALKPENGKKKIETEYEITEETKPVFPEQTQSQTQQTIPEGGLSLEPEILKDISSHQQTTETKPKPITSQQTPPGKIEEDFLPPLH